MSTRSSDLLRQLLACALGVACVSFVMVAPAAAEDDDDELTFEQRLIHNLLSAGGKPDIDYRERSPLVIPPSRDLQDPQQTATIRAPAWPNDPDAPKAGKKAPRNPRSAVDGEREAARNLRPDELRRGTVAGAGRNTGPAPSLSDNQASRPLRPSELGDTSLFGRLFGPDEKAEAPQAPPSRTKLTQPPSGYLMPSPNQPYAPPTGTTSWSLPSLFDRTTPSSTR